MISGSGVSSVINLEDRAALHSLLKKDYPDLFIAPYVPLAFNISEQLVGAYQDRFSVIDIKGYISRFLLSYRYLERIVDLGAKSPRYSLDGNESGSILNNDVTYALTKLSNHKKMSERDPGKYHYYQKLKLLHTKPSLNSNEA